VITEQLKLITDRIDRRTRRGGAADARPWDGALWSPVVATGGNQRQIGRARKGRKQAKTVAVRCDRLPRGVHGKQRVCRVLRPVARGPLPAKEGVDLIALVGVYLLLLQSGTDTGHNRKWRMPGGITLKILSAAGRTREQLAAAEPNMRRDARVHEGSPTAPLEPPT
jgi:hypothetical protein